ncbi:hypothetical protein F-S17_0200 [Faustovirus]|nr:hypothetical protein F-LCD7_0214 [Faustovirus]QJX72466.1 hypothetical protein F-S17_0200 [Faustovirus]QJX72974.1 hypothetical protein F-VV57_0212 [Faustovirus]QJX73479.1 hypothetical protein F-VV63_0213 [Faustovirus]
MQTEQQIIERFEAHIDRINIAESPAMREQFIDDLCRDLLDCPSHLQPTGDLADRITSIIKASNM